MCRRFWLRGPKGSLCTPRDRDGGMGSLSRRDAVAKLPVWGLTCGYFRDLWTEKSKLASMLVFWSPRGPRVPMAWGGCVCAAGYPMGCQIGRLTRHETPLARPSQATKISKPNRFAYPFRSRPRGLGSPLWLNSRPNQTSSYRDMANLGVRVRPRVFRQNDKSESVRMTQKVHINPIYTTLPHAGAGRRRGTRSPAREGCGAG
jgi:hypothetical protein